MPVSVLYMNHGEQKGTMQMAEMRFIRAVTGCRMTDRKLHQIVTEALAITDINMTIEEFVETKIYFHLNIIYGSKTSPSDKAHKVHVLKHGDTGAYTCRGKYVFLHLSQNK